MNASARALGRVAPLVVAAALAGCATAPSMAASPTPLPAPVVAARKPIDVRDVGGAWRGDPRWAARVAAVESAGEVALERVRAATGLDFEPGRGLVVEFDAAAPAVGDVALRFVDGVRRPVVRISPRALLSGEFLPSSDFATLVARGAIAAGAGEREPPAWVTRGVSLVVAESFDLELHRRALGGDAPRVRREELFGDAATDALAAGVRAKAVLRCARSQRPFARLLETLLSGGAEDAALAELGISRHELLDAATETERARASKAIAEDPALPSLLAARAALARRSVDEAEAALAPIASSLDAAGRDPWLVADARLCLAQIAMARGDETAASASIAAAGESAMIVRVREARIVETWLAVRHMDAARAWPEFVRDYPDAAGSRTCLELLGVRPNAVTEISDVVAAAASLDAAKRADAAARLAKSGSKELVPILRILAADVDETVRAAAAESAAPDSR